MVTKMGATVAPSTYTQATNYWNAAQIFDGYLGAPWAETQEKIFYGEGQWPGLALTDAQGASLITNGCKLILCLKPLRTMVASEITNLQNTINLYKTAGATFDVVLWQEPNNGGSTGSFPTPASYQTYVNYYAPTVQAAGVPLIYDASMGNAAQAVQWFPGYTYVTKIGSDYYCQSFKDHGSTLAGMINLALTAPGGPLPFSCYELGYSAQARVPTLNDFLGWLYNQVQIPLLTYIAEGGTIDSAMWYGVHNNWNFIGPNTPTAQINAMLALGAALTGGSPPPPPQVAPDYPDYFANQNSADDIAQTGAPLLVVPATPIEQVTITVAHNQKILFPNIPINQLGYEIHLETSIPGAATNPFLDIDMQWQDANSGLIVAEEKWILPAATGPASNVFVGMGPTKGSQLVMSVKNLDGAQTATVLVVFMLNSRIYSRDRWQQVVTNNPPGYTYLGDDSLYDVIGSLSALNINAGNSQARLCPLYHGDVSFYMDQLGNAAAVSLLELQAAPTSTFGTSAFWSASPAGGVGQGVTQILRFPRAPVLLTYTNNGTAVATVNAKIIALDERR